jgi:Carbamoyltransferase N-terminus
MTAILGISAFYHDSAAALVIDGDIVAAVQEERFTREKYDPRFPSQAIASCLYDDIELILKEEVFLFDPDYVVLMFFNGNDFRDTYLGLNKYTINDDETSQWNEGNAEEKIPSEYRLASAPTLKTSLRNHLATYRALANLKHSVVTSSSAKVDESILFNDFKVDKLFTSYTFWSQSAYPSIAVEAKNVSLQTLDRIRSYLQEKHVHLIIVAIPYREQVYVKSLSGSEYNVEYPRSMLKCMLNHMMYRT